jgi:hypothetical protein
VSLPRLLHVFAGIVLRVLLEAAIVTLVVRSLSERSRVRPLKRLRRILFRGLQERRSERLAPAVELSFSPIQLRLSVIGKVFALVGDVIPGIGGSVTLRGYVIALISGEGSLTGVCRRLVNFVLTHAPADILSDTAIV